MAPEELSHDRGRKKGRVFSQAHPASFTSPSSSRWTFHQSTAPRAAPTVKVDPPAQKPTPKMEKRQSKMSLFSLFAPPKVERSRGYTEAGLEAVPERQPSPQRSTVSRTSSRAPSSMSYARVDGPDTRQTLLSSASSINTAVSSLDGWSAPPLFQAYPQAIKYATLQSSTVSTEVLRRAQGHKRQMSYLQEQFQSSTNLTLENVGGPGVQTPSKLEKATLSKKRYSSALSSSAPLASKVYVLVTTGYILQYSGEGSSNRMPEKILALNKESAAFASDLIPGKHFVLEVRQSMSDEGNTLTVPQQQPRSLLKRLRSQPQLVKKSTNTMLLILDSADEMISWMKAVRRVIDDRNGRGHKPTPSTESKRDSGHSLDEGAREVPSHRYQVQRVANSYAADTSRDHSPAASRASSTGPASGPGVGVGVGEAGREAEALRAHPGTRAFHRSRMLSSDEPAGLGSAPLRLSNLAPRTSVRQSVEAPSFATTVSTVSQDQSRLDRLRDSRQSFLSNETSGTGTITITTSSSPPSPGETHLDVKPFNTATVSEGSPTVNTANRHNRRSIQKLPETSELPNRATSNGLRPLITLQSSISETNLLISARTRAEHSARRLSSYTPSASTRIRVNPSPSTRSQSALDYRRSSDHRISAISAVSDVSSVLIDDQQTEHEAATEAAAEIESMMDSSSRRVSTHDFAQHPSNQSLLSLHRQQQMQDKERIPASIRSKYRSSNPPEANEQQLAATQMQALTNPDERRLSALTSHSNLSSHSLSSLHKQQQAQDKGRIPAALREKYLARKRERQQSTPAHVRSAEEEAAAAQIEAITNPDEPRTSDPEVSTSLAEVPLALQHRQQQAQDKDRVPAALRQKFQNASHDRAPQKDENIDQKQAATQIKSIMDPEDRTSLDLGSVGKLPSQSLQTMYKSQQNQDKNRIPAGLREKYQAAALARQSRDMETIGQDAAVAQIEAITDPDTRPAPALAPLSKPAFQSVQSMHKNQLSQDKNRIPASTRKKYQRPIPIRVSQPSPSTDTSLPRASAAAEQPIIPKRLSSLTSQPSRNAQQSMAEPSPTSPASPLSPNIAHFPQPPKRGSLAPLPSTFKTSSSQASPGSAELQHIIASGGAPSNQSTPAEQLPAVNDPTYQGLRRPASLQVRSSSAAFLSSRSQPNAGSRRSFSNTNNSVHVRHASAQAGRVGHLDRTSPGSGTTFGGLETVGEARVLRAMGPSNPLKQASERLALRSGAKRAPSPIGVKVRVSMPTIGINGPPVRIEPMMPMSINLDALPAPPGPPPSCALPAVPGSPPARALPTIPGSARTSLRSTPTPTQQTVRG